MGERKTRGARRKNSYYSETGRGDRWKLLRSSKGTSKKEEQEEEEEWQQREAKNEKGKTR